LPDPDDWVRAGVCVDGLGGVCSQLVREALVEQPIQGAPVDVNVTAQIKVQFVQGMLDLAGRRHPQVTLIGQERQCCPSGY
jgi:hypothetical protein